MGERDQVMSHQNQFNRELDKLFRRRTDSLRHHIGQPRKGKTPEFNKKLRERTIKELTAIAREAQVHEYAERAFSQRAGHKSPWWPKEHGPGEDRKKAAFRNWYQKKKLKKSCIYVHWHNKQCVYVGRTEIGTRRITNHFSKSWFPSVTRIDVYPARGKKDLPALECLAIDKFKPRKNDVSAANKRGAAKCPLCKSTRKIKSELRAIFPLK
jgi:hypothetical protein